MKTREKIYKKHKSAIHSITSMLFRILTGPISIFLVVNTLSIEQQAVYYSFLTISSIQWVFELGVTTALIQYIAKSSDWMRKEASIKLGCLFYILMSIMSLLAMLLYGFWLFSNIEINIWFGPFVFFIIFISINVFINIALIVEESVVSAEGVYLKKLLSSVIYSITLIGSLASQFELYSLAIAQIVMALFYVGILRKGFNIVRKSLSADMNMVRNVFFDVKGFQIKVALVWLVGYCYWNFYSIFSLKFVSITFNAQFGITNAVFSALALAATSFLQTKRVDIGRAISEGNILSSNKCFKSNLVISASFYLFSTIIFIFLFIFLSQDYSDRFLGLGLIVQYAILRFIAMISEMLLIYLRMFLDEPIYKITMWNYIITPSTSIPSFYILGVDHLFVFPIISHMVFTLFYIKKSKVFINERLA
ncbi:hypothetical protein [Grimontia hollisae]|uniref:hypothetical protein n=1 Tax=Grimontia hollisae TaxID=673 RepID=UPI0012ACB7C1|nr:hypothetical protein [Grimontia hollisae]